MFVNPEQVPLVLEQIRAEGWQLKPRHVIVNDQYEEAVDHRGEPMLAVWQSLTLTWDLPWGDTHAAEELSDVVSQFSMFVQSYMLSIVIPYMIIIKYYKYIYVCIYIYIQYACTFLCQLFVGDDSAVVEAMSGIRS